MMMVAATANERLFLSIPSHSDSGRALRHWISYYSQHQAESVLVSLERGQMDHLAPFRFSQGADDRSTGKSQ